MEPTIWLHNARRQIGVYKNGKPLFRGADFTMLYHCSTSCLPFYQHYEWTAEEKAAENLLARKNFLIMPLYDAADYLAKSQLNTTVEEQMTRIQTLVNAYTKVTVDDGRNTL